MENSLKDNLQLIISNSNIKQLFEHDIHTQDIENFKSSTAVRVLLSEEYYEKLKDNYYLINALHKEIYHLYSFEEQNKKKVTDEKEEVFSEFLKHNRPIKDYFWTDSFWQLDTSYKTLRKESVKLICDTGRYLEKELKNDPNAINEGKYRNVEIIHPTHKFDETDESSGNNKHNWIYGKYANTDSFTIRFYWNFNPIKETIAELLFTIQVCFDNNQIPFSFKFLSDIEDYKSKTDCAVLYLPRRHALISFQLVRDIYRQFESKKDFFVDSCPMFTKKIKNGLSFGENPDDRRYTSFGSYRSIHIAMALVTIYKRNKKYENITPDAIIEILNGKINRANVGIMKNPFNIQFFLSKVKNGLTKLTQQQKISETSWTSRFYVNQYSNTDYKNEIAFFDKTYNNPREVVVMLPVQKSISNEWLYENKNNDRKKYLFIAVKIANLICKEAIWYKTEKDLYDYNYYYPLLCNWFSFDKKLTDDSKKTVGYEFKLLDNTFLKGRLGVAFFLKMIHRAYKDEIFYRTSYRAFQGSIFPRNKNDEDTYLFNWVYQQIKDTLIKKVFNDIEKNSNEVIEKEFEIKRSLNAWKDSKFRVIDKVVFTNSDITNDDKIIINELMSEYFDVERPFGNALGTDEFCASICDGYALLGYCFLRLYDSITFKRLPYKVTYE